MYQRIYNSISNNKEKDKLDIKKLFSSMSEKYIKTIPKFKLEKEKKDKVVKIKGFKNEVNFRNKLLGLRQNTELEKNNYDIERNNYYKKAISKRLHFLFGGKKK